MNLHHRLEQAEARALRAEQLPSAAIGVAEKATLAGRAAASHARGYARLLAAQE